MNAVAIFHHVNHVGYLGFEGRVSSKMGAGLQARRGRGFKQDGGGASRETGGVSREICG